MKCRPCGLHMPIQADGAFRCPSCEKVVRLTEFTGGSGPTIVSRPSPVLEMRRKRVDAKVLDPEFDLGIETSLRGSFA